MKNFQKHKFRCSRLGELMTNPRSKKDLLSKTTQSYLREIYIEEVYGRKKEIDSKFLEKGLFAEEDSLSLASKHYKNLLVKNKKRLENDYISGKPDILLASSKILDVKTSWDIFTFMESDGTDKNYYWQLQGYMALTERKKADLAYCLVNTPEHIIVSEKTSQAYKLGIMDDTKQMAKMEEEVDRNMHFDDIPAKKRIRVYSFDFDSEGYEKLMMRIIEARRYLNSLDL